MKCVVGVSVLLAILLTLCSSSIVRSVQSIEDVTTAPFDAPSIDGMTSDIGQYANLSGGNEPEQLAIVESPSSPSPSPGEPSMIQEPGPVTPTIDTTANGANNNGVNQASKSPIPAQNQQDSNQVNLQEKRNLAADEQQTTLARQVQDSAQDQQQQQQQQPQDGQRMMGMPRTTESLSEPVNDPEQAPQLSAPSTGDSGEAEQQPASKQSASASAPSTARGMMTDTIGGHVPTPPQAYQTADGQTVTAPGAADGERLPPPRVIEKNKEVQPPAAVRSNSDAKVVAGQQSGAQIDGTTTYANGTQSTARTYGLDWTSCSGSDTGKAGICKNDIECKKSKGRAEGSCMAGLGVCCVIALSCGDKSVENNTFFANPDFPDGSWEARLCEVEVKKKSKNILQVMIEFEEFELAPPSDDGECLTDVFQVKLASSRPSPYSSIRLCGQNVGQHLYLDVSQIDDPIVLSVATSGAGFARRWSIKIIQMDEKNHLLAPPGCLQYYSDTTGHFRSFNLGRNIRNLYYAVCFRIDNGYTGLRFIDNFFGMSGPFCPQAVGRRKQYPMGRLPPGPPGPYGPPGPHGPHGYPGPYAGNMTGPYKPVPAYHPQHLVIPPPGYFPPPTSTGYGPASNAYSAPQSGAQNVAYGGQPQPQQQQQQQQLQPQMYTQAPPAQSSPAPSYPMTGRYKRTTSGKEGKTESAESDRLYNIRRTRTHFEKDPFEGDHNKGKHWEKDKDDKFDKFEHKNKFDGPSPHGYGPPPGYGPHHGYGPPPGYGPPGGYNSPGYGPPGYGQSSYGPSGYGSSSGYGPSHGYGPNPGAYGEMLPPPGYHHGHMHHKEIDKFGKKYEQLYYQDEKSHKKDDKKDDKWWMWSGKKDDKKDKFGDKKDKKETRHHEALFPEIDMFEPPHCEPRFCGGTDVITFPPSGESISEMCGNRFNRGRGSVIVTGTPLVVYVSNRGVARGFGFDIIYEQVFAVPHRYGHQHHGH